MSRPSSSIPIRSTTPVAILGAGLTGMSAAFHLERAGVPFRIFERLGSRPAATRSPLEEDGLRFDRTGHLLHLRDPDMRALALSWIGDDWLEVERRSMIWSNGVYTRYPFQANTFGLPPQVAYECLRASSRRISRQDKPEPRNFEEFCLTHFGEGISRHFMIPYNTRLWGVPPSEITADWCSRFVPSPQARRRGRRRRRSATIASSATTPAFSTRGSASASSRRASPRAVPDRARPRAHNHRLARARAALRGRASSATTCSISHHADASADRPSRRPARARRRGREAPPLHPPLLPRRRPRHALPEAAHWVYVPEEKYPFYRVGCYSHFSPGPGAAGQSEPVRRAGRSRRRPISPRSSPRSRRGFVEMGLIDDPQRGALRAPPSHRPRLRGLRSRLLPLARGDSPLPRRGAHRLDGALRGLELLVDGGRAPLRPRRREGGPDSD